MLVSRKEGSTTMTGSHTYTQIHTKHTHLKCLHPAGLFDLVVDDRTVLTDRLIPCSQTDGVLEKWEGEKKMSVSYWARGFDVCVYVCESPCMLKMDFHSENKPCLCAPYCERLSKHLISAVLAYWPTSPQSLQHCTHTLAPAPSDLTHK